MSATAAPASNAPARMHGGDAAREIAVGDARESSITDQAGKALLIRELANAFDKITIGIGSTGGQLTKARDHLERVEVIELIEQRYVDMGKFEA